MESVNNEYYLVDFFANISGRIIKRYCNNRNNSFTYIGKQGLLKLKNRKKVIQWRVRL